VFREVIPAVVNTGSYSVAPAFDPASLSRLQILEMALESERALESTKIELGAARSALVEVAPMVEAYQDLMDSEGFISMGAAARALNMGRQTLFDELRRLNIIQKHENLPYRTYDRYFDVKFSTYEKSDGTLHTAKPTLRVRPEGLDYLRRRLTTGLAEVV
jgi:phage antirepressor YoqD-like protein